MTKLAMRIASWSLGILIPGLLCISCGSESELLAQAQAQELAAPALVGLGAQGKATSGAPAGIYVTWQRVDDPRATGYYVYRDTESIPDPLPGETIDPALRVNDGNPVPQEPVGEFMTHNDLFNVTIGQEYFYRVTVLNSDDPPAESYPSNEMSWVVHGHNVTTVAPDTAYWGDSVTISGDTFGTYDPGNDLILFTAIGGGTVEGTVDTWADTEITATVPAGSDTGPVYVVVQGTPAPTDNDLTILNPIIYSLEDSPGFLEQPLTIHGKNFGDAIVNSTVAIGGVDVTSEVTSWNGTQIMLNVPVDTAEGDVTVLVDMLHPSNAVLFIPRPEIFSADPVAVQTGEPLTLTGRLFGSVEGDVFLDGATPLVVSAWADTEVSIVLEGSEGLHTITVVDDAGTPSNDFEIVVSMGLSVVLSGLDPMMFYRWDAAPPVGVTTADDADSVELLIDGEVVSISNTVPFDNLSLPVYMMQNGQHTIMLRAHRRAVSADSNEVIVNTYSLVGDVNADGVVDGLDRDELEGVLGITSDDPGFLPWYDTDEDGEVTEADLSAVGYYYGDTTPEA